MFAAELYGMITFLNHLIGSRHYKKFSKLEKIGITSSIALGIDSIIVPAFTDGRTFHEILGFSPQETLEYGIEVAEGGLALLGTIYHAGRNLYFASRPKTQHFPS